MTDYGHDIEKYLKGELTPAERNALEKKALSDPFLADALEGAEQIKAGDFVKDVSQLNERIASNKTVSAWKWAARIAAGLAFILVSTFIIWSIMETEPSQELAMEKNEKAAAPPPATSDSISSATEVLSSPTDGQPTAGPVINDKKDVVKQPTIPIQTETKPQVASGEAQAKNEPVTEAIAARRAEEKTDELRVTEPVAQAKDAEKEAVSKAKAEDDQYRAKAITRSAEVNKKKALAADSKAATSEAPKGYAYSINTPNVIKGKITSAEDGSALPGVNVIIKGSSTGTVTDAAGNYQIDVDNSNVTLLYSFIGLQGQEVAANNREEIDVQMANDVTQLSEVITTAYGVQGAGESLPPTVDLAHPEIGNRAYKKYLEGNIRYPEQARTNKTEGRVTVEFTVEPNGALTNLTIIRGIGSGCDEELIRLIKEGSRWVPTKKGDVPTQDKAKVRLRFVLPK